MIDCTADIEKYLKLLEKKLNVLKTREINQIVNILKTAYDHGNTIFTMGNGGSGTIASHIVCDFNKGASAHLNRKFRVMCLNDNMPSVSAIANDISYDAIFVEQLKNFLQPADVVIGISSSGNSRNIIRAIDYANKKGAVTVGFCGFDGGKLKNAAQFCVHIDVDDMKVAEDIHSIISHMMMKMLSAALQKSERKQRQPTSKPMPRKINSRGKK
ncbi:MAG TPA: SIS domain-containing protein [Smithella sp.]|nr:SIS domain-containing protein [Smithella sp.]MDM7987592.1 SIS domain-containing protein [Smithella sp.]HNY51138.1 SIS domain-containing protein [Smithella sp.]HOG90584.1 SIS domain-containing protein [Smithella sp.]HOU50406.1 SIS domain-containing protein [Smithella sp.]